MRILVVEDRQDEQVLARKTIEAVGGYCEIAGSLQEAYLLIGELLEAWGLGDINEDSPEDDVAPVQWDGVITDLHFPLVAGGEASEPNGFEIVEYCRQNSIPVVIHTDIDHHKVKWPMRLARLMGIHIEDLKGRPGSWERALRSLG